MTTTAVKPTAFVDHHPDVDTENIIHARLLCQRKLERLEDEMAKINETLLARIPVGETVESFEAKVTVVQSTTEVIDFETLQAVAPKGFFYKVTKRVVDMPAFKALRTVGQVPQEVLDVVTTKTSAPFPRVTVKKS